MSLKTKHIVLVGDSKVGKTSIFYSFFDKTFNEHYETTVVNNVTREIIVDGEKYLIKVHDTSGRDEPCKIRVSSLSVAHCVILCYSIDDKQSFLNITNKWCLVHLKELQSIPYILVGTKGDLREERGEVTKKSGESLKDKIGANSFVECSARVHLNVTDVIEQAVRAIKNGPVAGSRQSCVIS